ncbi:hypothetical protein [Paraglaciecola psychrophila]|nr:hypothetical protein [Paraglaciecola psychrophila]GAC37790.1 hypothetical protein GPSY_2168 [Paraglaciecola psychrophila 170]
MYKLMSFTFYYLNVDKYVPAEMMNRAYFRPTRYYFLINFLLLLVSTASQGEPLIQDPTFSRLSTDNGLSQNTINSLLLDDEGFL